MEAEELSVPAVRALVVAMRDGDRDAFYAGLTDDAVLTDDGREQPLRTWAEREVFTAHGRYDVEREENGGLRLIGRYKSDQWQMKAFWNVELRDGKVSQLDVGAM